MLKVSGLFKRYDTARADAFSVRDVSFEVAQGEFFTLLGPSGCGKTTTLRSIAGLETPDSGEIAIDGVPVFSSSRRLAVPVAKRDIAMVFQSYAIWPHMTVRENVAFPLDAAGIGGAEATTRVGEALAMVGLADFAERPAPMLSGGQQQRVALARAIVKRAKVLLLDEPLSNLDAKLREQMRVELRELQRTIGTTAIYVTHDQDEALSLSDRIAVMKDGEIVELDTPQALYLRPRTEFAARFVGQADLFDCTIAGRDGETTLLDTKLGRLRSASAPPPAVKHSLLVRPEHVEFHDGGGVNTLAGTIERVVFSGRMVEYLVRVGDVALPVHTTSRFLKSQGERVTIRLPPERCVIVAAGR
jgi:iron(III) transport system ATP-binding protein